MKPELMTKLAKPMLFSAALIWGTSFFIMKNALDVMPVFFLLAIRFTAGACLLALVCWKKWKDFTWDYLWRGAIIGGCLFLAYAVQTFGLARTTPSKNAFLTAVYCVIVPFLYWLVTKERPRAHHILCVFLCLSGVGILSLSGGWGMSSGDLLTVLSGIPCAANIVISAIACRNRNVLLLTTIELWVVTLLAWVLVFAGGGLPTGLPMDALGGIVYLGLIATALCLYMQSYGLKYAEPAIAGMLLSLESVFGVVFSIILYHETITLRMVAGFAVIFLAILLSQWDGRLREKTYGFRNR